MKQRHRTLILFIVFILITSINPRSNAKADLNTVDAETPATTYRDVSSGYNHSCALTPENQLKCWGSNTSGQIGNNYISRSTPATMTGLENDVITQFVTGGYNSCIINSAGALKCWGANNQWKQLGNPAYNGDMGTPVIATGMESGVISASIGNGFICAIKNDGGIYCWGLDYYLSYQEPYEWVLQPVPILIDTILGAKEIKSSGDHSCVRTAEDQLMCWGSDQQYPGLVTGINNVEDFSLGESQTCAITRPTETEPQKIYCWGGSTFDEWETTPVISGETSTPLKVAAGKEHTCMILEVGGVRSVYCMGSNQEGQVGTGSFDYVSEPSPVAGTEGALAISAGEFHSNVVLDSGLIKSWGGNTFGQLGNGFFFRRQLPIHLDTTLFPEGLLDVVSGENHTCALTTTGAVKCWGGNLHGQLGNGTVGGFVEVPVQAVGLESGVSQLSSGTYHTCALLDTGEVKCWGYNVAGLLGTGHPDNSDEKLPTPAFVILGTGGEHLTGVTQIDCGSWHTCALLVDGSVSCWGANDVGQLGSPVPTEYSTIIPFPVTVPFEGSFKDIALGRMHSCAIASNGTVFCWGVNYNGELGLGYMDWDAHPTPTLINYPYSDAAEIDSGGDRTCMKTDSAGVYCWGNYSGYDYDQGEVFPIVGLRGPVKSLSTGGNTSRYNQHTCAVIESTGAVQCWGENGYSQLGDGTYNNYTSNDPVDVVGLSANVARVTASGDSACAFFESGAAACWGFDYQVQSLPVDLIEVDEQDRPPSIFFSNYYEGASESYFVITGLYFPPNQLVYIYIDEVLEGSMLANETGTFKFFAYLVEEGEHVVRVESADMLAADTYFSSRIDINRAVGVGSLSINIDTSSSQRIKEGGGYTIGLRMDNFIYLPLILR